MKFFLYLFQGCEKEIKKLAYQWSTCHGLQLSNEEKRKYACEMIGEMTIEELSHILSVSRQSIENWTRKQREAIEEERNRQIVELYLHAENTQEKIAELMEMPRQTITDIIKKFAEISTHGKIGQEWNLPSDHPNHDSAKPFLYSRQRI